MHDINALRAEMPRNSLFRGIKTAGCFHAVGRIKTHYRQQSDQSADRCGDDSGRAGYKAELFRQDHFQMGTCGSDSGSARIFRRRSRPTSGWASAPIHARRQPCCSRVNPATRSCVQNAAILREFRFERVREMIFPARMSLRHCSKLRRSMAEYIIGARLEKLRANLCLTPSSGVRASSLLRIGAAFRTGRS